MGSSASVGANAAHLRQPGAEEKEQARGLTATTFGSVEFCRYIEARTPTFGSLESSSSSEGEDEGPSMQPSKVGPHGDDHEAWMQQLLWFQPDTFADAAFQRWEKNQKIHPMWLKTHQKAAAA
ncbi:unnamed protein product [Polarella glacialis]|uniref:Uncharacterized protein n=1 Tax=Polarella glacialis TaxID=89957 RepID=A0A813IBE2_POLGL|nr:unnamed protein product [Polarella glacialis]CAE8647704.1 unnamed protein product [Polarella glacialis]